jgi:trans-aconitate methyltransferase
MDFGCGPGFAADLLLQEIGVQSYVGVDTSTACIDAARSAHRDPRTEFFLLSDYAPAGDVGLAYCNGVFHHIKTQERPRALEYIRESLLPGGLLALWENNPLNPGTRYVMSQIPFDRDAATLRAGQARRMAQHSGFQVLSVTYLFVFPRLLAPLRLVEPYLSFLPCGAQYQILCRKAG